MTSTLEIDNTVTDEALEDLLSELPSEVPALVAAGIPYADHEFHRVSNDYLVHLKEKARISLFGTEDKEKQATFLDAATAILDYRAVNEIVIK